MLYVTNSSTLVSDDDVATMTRACAKQNRYHAAPVWDRQPTPIVFVPHTDARAVAAPGAVVIAVLDDPDQANALGWHTEDAGDLEYGRVFARPVLDAGGDALTRTLSVASVLSHEALEWFVDRHCNLWADRGDGTAVAVEVGDPVESDSYVIPVTPRGGSQPVLVTVSNFVHPTWFDPAAAATAQFDHMNQCTRPFQLTAGGYVVTLTEGQTGQTYGADYPDWRKATKLADISRTARRLTHQES